MAVTFISIAGGGSNGKDQPGEEILEGEGGVMMEDVQDYESDINDEQLQPEIIEEPVEEIYDEPAMNGLSKYNFIFYFIYKYKYENRMTMENGQTLAID